MDDKESIADIVSDLRDRANNAAKAVECPSPAAVAAMLASFAARIEAAAKREMAKGMSKKLDENRAITGNAAALRKACKAVLAAYKSGAIHTSYEDGEKCDEYDDELCDLKAIVDIALAAPARNCDRFNSGEEAWIAFERERPNWCDEHSSKDPDCTDCEMADCGRCMAEWLFATEEEGEE